VRIGDKLNFVWDASMKLTAELVPKTALDKSLYRLLPSDVWNHLRNSIIKKAEGNAKSATKQKERCSYTKYGTAMMQNTPKNSTISFFFVTRAAMLNTLV
jgi:hypothetical protein